MTDAIQKAAVWLATGGAAKGQAIVPQLQREFGLTAKEAVDALRAARLMRGEP